MEGYWNIHQVDQKSGGGGWKPSESLSVAEKHSQDQATGEMALGDTLDFAALTLPPAETPEMEDLPPV